MQWACEYGFEAVASTIVRATELARERVEAK